LNAFVTDKFLSLQERLLKTEGVLDTVAGYTGNPSADNAPNYDSVCFGRNWVEGVRVMYDDSKVSYEQLLYAFFEAQEPKLGSRQYASIIFPHDDEQEQVAKEWMDKGIRENRVSKDGVPLEITQVEPLSPFYQAEGYHQRYWQKQRPRFAAGIALLAVASGILDSLVPEVYQSTLHTAANGAVLLGCAYVVLERKIDAKVTPVS
jgi:methionine-S-sulfoxide reductase